ncbi:MAG TPA: hypothetical protein VN253_27135, partial [Kofleriaceae bacterium]|nr:hypothetical protein [Kofleriaceae bacterium]
MGRTNRQDATELDEQPPRDAEQRQDTSLAAMAALYHQVAHVSHHLDALAASLAGCPTLDGLLAFRRVCVGLMVTDELIALVVDGHAGDLGDRAEGPAGGHPGAMEAAHRLREELLVDAVPWL